MPARLSMFKVAKHISPLTVPPPRHVESTLMSEGRHATEVKVRHKAVGGLLKSASAPHGLVRHAKTRGRGLRAGCPLLLPPLAQLQRCCRRSRRRGCPVRLTAPCRRLRIARPLQLCLRSRANPAQGPGFQGEGAAPSPASTCTRQHCLRSKQSPSTSQSQGC